MSQVVNLIINKYINPIKFSGAEPLLHRLPCSFPDKVSVSQITYDPKYDIKLGSLLHTDTKNDMKFYSIATGKTIEKNNKQYYEVWADLFNYQQTRILAAAFRTMNFPNDFQRIEK